MTNDNISSFEKLIDRIWDNEEILNLARIINCWWEEYSAARYECAEIAADIIYDAYGDDWCSHDSNDYVDVLNKVLDTAIERYDETN